jgi:hypothetical protein
MNVIAMRMEQAITDVRPRPFGPGPRAEELYRVAEWLRPSPIPLQGFVKSPPQVLLSFSARDGPGLLGGGYLSGSLAHLIPPLLPAVEPDPADGIDVGRTPDLMMPHHTGLEEQSDGRSFSESSLQGKALQDCL